MDEAAKNSRLLIESLERILLMSASPIEGSSGNDWISGTDLDDLISAGAGDDTIHAPLGSNVIDGEDGFDTFVVYEGDADDYAISLGQDDRVIVEGPGMNGATVTNELRNVEQILFNDGPVVTAELAERNDSLTTWEAAPEDNIDEEPSSSQQDVSQSASTPSKSDKSKTASEKTASDKTRSNKTKSNKAESEKTTAKKTNKHSASLAQKPAEPTPPRNSAPVAVADDYVLQSGEAFLGNVLSNDEDADHDELVVELSTLPGHGHVVLNADGTFSYVSHNGYAGSDSFRYRLVDDHGAETFGVVNLQINAPTQAESTKSISQPASSPVGGPVAQDDVFTASPGETFFGNVSVNDTDIDGPSYGLTFRLLADPSDGRLNLYSDGSFDFAVTQETIEPVDFVYEVTDADGNSDQATGRVLIDEPRSADQQENATAKYAQTIPTNLPNLAEAAGAEPTAPDSEPQQPIDFSTYNEVTLGTGARIIALNVNGSFSGDLTDDNDPTASSQNVVSSHTDPQFGSINVSDDGTFQYSAANDFQGTDYFHYTRTDGQTTDHFTIIVHVNEQGLIPESSLDLLAAEMVVSPIVFDLNGDGIINVTGPTTAQARPAGADFGDTVEFDIDGDGTVNEIEWIDGSGDGLLVDTSQFHGTNIDGRALFGDEGGTFQNGFEKLNLLDRDGNRLLEGGELSTLKLWVDNGDGRLSGDELRTLQHHDIFAISTRMTPTPEGLMQSQAFTGDDSEILTEDVWFAERVEEIDDEPSGQDNAIPDADPDVIRAGNEGPITGNVLSNDTDPDGDSLLVTRYSRPVHGTLAMSDDGNFTYTPDDGFEGVDYFQYEVTDGRGGTDVAVATLHVQGSTAVNVSGNRISGTVWFDENANGLKDSTEITAGSDIFVSLLSDSGNIVDSLHTDRDGGFAFDGLDDGEYRVQIATSSLPTPNGAAAQLTHVDVNSNFYDAVDSDVDPVSGKSAIVTLHESNTHAIVDAGFRIV